jgi:hypothetical protein
MSKSTIAPGQIPDTLGYAEVRPILPLKAFRGRHSALESDILAHVQSCPSCQDFERSIDANTPWPENCQLARIMAAGYLGRPLQEDHQSWYDTHVDSCSACFDMAQTLHLLGRFNITTSSPC